MWELVQLTTQYSHAVLLAVLPYISDFSKRLDLPVPAPITTNQVSGFKCDPRLGQTGGVLTLTNGCQFTFLEGRVTLYRSPESYFSLQDMELIPRFYGPVRLTEKQSLAIALSVIGKLGYEKSAFNASKPPLITPPEKIGTNYIPRYRFRWLDPNVPTFQDAAATIPALLDVEVNAESGRIEMVVINSRYTRQPSPKVDMAPPLLHRKRAANNPQGTPTKSVSTAYASAFLNSILPQLSEFIAKAGLSNSVPTKIDRSEITNYICRIIDGKPIAQLFLSNGDRFNYEHGHVEAFYAHDAMDKFPETGDTSDFLGHINMTTIEAISLCENVMKNMGYTNKFGIPIISYAPGTGTVVCTRYSYYWRHTGADQQFASFEVDMETKRIKSIFLRDPAFERESPKIDLSPTNAPVTGARTP
jgi:hypothetical protein